MAYPRSIVATFAVFMFAAILSQVGCGKVKQMVSPAAAHYRQKWEASGINSYRMLAVIQKPGHQTPMGTYEIRVRDGRFESAYNAGLPSGDDIKVAENPLPQEWVDRIRLSSYGTIDSIFAHIEAAEKQSNSRFEVDYHPTLGYPTYFHVDPSSSTIDDELLIKVIQLDPLQ